MVFDIQWNLLGRPADIGGAFQAGMERGTAARKAREQENALRAYAMNPNDQNALAGVTQANPMLGMQLGERAARAAEEARQRQQQQQTQITEKQREMIKFGANLLREVKTPEQYQQARRAYAMAGFDVSEVPEQYDPGYVAQVIQAGQGLSPQSQSPDLVVIDGVAIDKRTGQPMFESPYDKIVSGPGGIYRQPRIGIGRGGTGPAPQGQAVGPQGLPAGWTVVDDEEEGGAGQPAPRTF